MAGYTAFPDICGRPLALHVRRLAYPAKGRLQILGAKHFHKKNNLQSMMTSLSALQIKEIERPQGWDQFVLDHKTSVYGHLFNWRRVIRDAYGHESIYLAAVEKSRPSKENEQGAIHGILPLIRFKRPFMRPDWVSIPFFDTAGLLTDDHKIGSWLMKKSSVIMAVSKPGIVELRQNAPFDDGYPETLLQKRPEIFQAKVGLAIDLSGSQQAMMKGFKSKLRSQIQKGIKNGLTWDVGKERLLDPFYQVFSRNMRDLGSPVHSKKFFKAIFTYFYSNAFICVIFYQSTPVAASFMFTFKKSLANPWASSIREFRHLNSNMVLYWQMIRFACNMGLEIFDMGRSSRGAPTYRFKKQWGPVETPLFWYQWPLVKKKYFKETLSIRSWKKCPLKAANMMGSLVRRYISL